MRVVVTGGSGQVGRALVATAPAGWQVFTPGRDQCDLADPATILATIADYRPDVLINAAAHTAVDRAEQEEALATVINATAPAVMRAAMRAQGGRLVQISSDYVFDGASDRPIPPDAPRHPLNAYGRSKAAGEDAAGPEALVLRSSWIYAAGGGNFVRTMLRLMRGAEPLRVVVDEIGAPTWATGLAHTLWGLVRAGACGVYHHRDAGAVSRHDWAIAIRDEALTLGLLTRVPPIIPVTSADFSTPARRPPRALLDDSATRALLGDAPTPWRVNLRRMLEEEQALEHHR